MRREREERIPSGGISREESMTLLSRARVQATLPLSLRPYREGGQLLLFRKDFGIFWKNNSKQKQTSNKCTKASTNKGKEERNLSKTRKTLV